MATEASQPLKISLPVSAALAQALYNEWNAATISNPYAGTPAQYTFVIVNAAGNLDLMANNTDVPIGVIQNAPFIVSQGASQVGGGVGEVVVMGVSKVRVAAAGVALAATVPGNSLICSVSAGYVGCVQVSGAFVSSATPGASVVGQALQAGNALDMVKALVNCGSPLPIGQ
jgi:hypothetical protein